VQVQADLAQLSEASLAVVYWPTAIDGTEDLHALLDEHMGKPLGTQVLEELLERDSTVKLQPDFDVDELKKLLLP